MRNIILLLALAISTLGCVEPIDHSFSKLPPGIWRGVLLLDNNPYTAQDGEEVSTKMDFSGELPFNFEVVYDSPENFHIVIHNADERIKASEIKYGRDKATAKDTMTLDFPVFDTYISAIYEENIMEGFWHVNYKDGYKIPFKAYHGKAHRFTTLKKKPTTDISGKWAVKFEEGTDDEYPAIGEFQQTGNQLTGTFLTETGDYRYLEGTIQENKIFLSTFDAAHAFLFEGKLTDDNSLIGSFRSGKHYTSTWSAKRDAEASIGGAFDLTSNTIGDAPFEFSFPNIDGTTTSLSDEQFKDKIKLVKITGTWCPNCKDETKFLQDYIANNPSEDIEVIEVFFERYKDEKKSYEVLNRYKEKFKIPFTMLYGGYASKALTSDKFPQLSKVISYPTLVFVDQENKIRKIHTGFAGPATSEYADFKTEFDNTIKALRKEKSEY